MLFQRSVGRELLTAGISAPQQRSRRTPHALSDNGHVPRATFRDASIGSVIASSSTHSLVRQEVTQTKTLANNLEIDTATHDFPSALALDHAMDDFNHDTTQSSGSLISALSQLEDTDEVGRQMLEHVRRDQERARHATSGSVQAFRKARPQHRVALTMENLERNNNNEKVKRDAPDQVSDSETSTPPQALPRQWARKGQQRNNFLRRLSTQSLVEDLSPKEQDPDSIYPRRTLFTGDSPRGSIDWTTTAADIPLPSVERESPVPADSGQFIQRRHQSRNDSLDRILELEQDLKNIGSPVAVIAGRRRIPQSTMRREIEDVKVRAVTTSRLDAITGGSLRKSRSLGFATENNGEIMSVDDLNKDEEVRIRQSTSPKKSDQELGLSGSSNITTTATEHIAGRKQDARDLLKRLARSVSSTPSPRGKLERRPLHRPRPSHDKSSQRKESQQQLVENILPTPEPTPDADVNALLIDPKTPIVTGGWVDTPNTRTVRKSDLVPANLEIDRQDETLNDIPPRQRNTKESSHPKSALEAVLRGASENKAGADNTAIGDDTIASLQDLLGDDVDFATIQKLDDDTLDLISNVKVPVTRSEDQRQQEQEALKRMAETLRAARSSLRDASRGMKRVEHQVGVVQDKVEGHCEHCGSHGPVTLSGLLYNAWLDFKSRFYRWPKNGRFHLTWLGLIWLSFVLWSISEVTLCQMYCRRVYARTMVGYGINLNAPELPFVTLTILGRPFEWAWRPIFELLRPFTNYLYVLVFGENEDDKYPEWIIAQHKLRRQAYEPL